MNDFRTDFSNSLVHFTRDRKGEMRQKGVSDDQTCYSALDVLCQILESGKILGSNNTGFVKGNQSASCFTECPLSSVKLFATDESDEKGKYRFYGIAISKEAAFKNGARPVIYLPDDEAEWIPPEQKWRHVQFKYGEVDWTFEREWRAKGDFDLKAAPGLYVIHWCPSEQSALQKSLNTNIKGKIRGYLPMKHLNQMF